MCCPIEPRKKGLIKRFPNSIFFNGADPVTAPYCLNSGDFNMRTYGKIYSNFWEDDTFKTFRSLPDFEFRLIIYLFTCKHGNVSGCFRLPVGYIVSDLELPSNTREELIESRAKVGNALQKLVKLHCIFWDEIHQWVCVPMIFAQFIDNHKEISRALYLLEKVPDEVNFIEEVSTFYLLAKERYEDKYRKNSFKKTM